MATNTDLKKQLDGLQVQYNQLKDVYYRTNFIDKSVFINPVYFNDVINTQNRRTLSRNITTTTATTTAIHTSTLGLYGNGLMFVSAVVNGINGQAKYGSYTLKAVIKFVFGSATILASTVTTEFETDATWNVTITTSGVNYLINVVSSADTILWKGTVEEYT